MNTYISQGNVATYVMCGRICKDPSIVNFPENVSLKEFFETFGKGMKKSTWSPVWKCPLNL